MSSWSLLLRLLPREDRLGDHPVAQREMALPPRWPGRRNPVRQCATTAIISFSTIWVVLFVEAPGAAGFLLFSSTFCFLFPLLALAPSLIAWVLPLSLALAPAVARERERGTWDMLRVTPLGVDSILLAKAAGGVWRLRSLLRNGRVMLVLIAFGSGFVLSTRWRQDVADIVPDAPVLLMTLASTLIVSVGALIVLADRAQQAVLMAVSALGASAVTRSERIALVGGVALTFGAWLADTAIGIVVMALTPNHTINHSGLRAVTVFTLGPVGAYMVNLPVGTLLPVTALTLAVREIVIRVVWRGVCAAANR